MAEQVSSLKTGIIYKDTPIGNVPVDWKVAAFSELAEINPKRNLRNWTTYPFIEMAAITSQSHRVQYPKLREFKGGGSKFQNGDTIFARITPCTENGKTAYVDFLDENQCGHGSTEFIIFGPKKGVDGKFIYYVAKWDKVRNIAVSKMEGTSGRQRVPSRVFVEDILVPIPPFNEQKKIAEILTAVDETIEKTDKIIAKTKEVKKGLMQRLFTRGIGHKKFKKTEIGEIPKEWSLLTLEEIVPKARGSIKRGPFGGAIKKEFFVPEGYKVYEQKNVIYNDFVLGDYYIDEDKFEELKDFQISQDDLLISCSGTIGRIVLVPRNVKKGIMNQALLRITLDEEKMRPEFFKHLFETDSMQKKVISHTHGSAMKNIVSMTELKKIQLVVPSIEEQNEIVELIDVVDSKVEDEQSYKSELEQIKKGLMQVLLTGKIRVKL